MIPQSDIDLFSDDVVDNPYDAYRELRDLGPVVYLTRLEMFAISRYDDVRQTLLDASTFCSGQGVGLNDAINELGRGTLLASDGEEHAHLRAIVGRPLTPKSLADLRPDAQALADGLVGRLVERRTFDAVTDLATVIPTTWVPDLIGWPDDGRDHLVAWGEATFNVMGPMNERAQQAVPSVMEMVEFAARVANSGAVPPGTMAAGIIDAAEQGEIEPAQCPALMLDYLGPSLDTTISALGNAIWLFAEHQDQWELLRRDPSLLQNAFNEVLRYDAPLTMFSRVTTTETTIGGVDVAAGSRVLVMYASANRDERRWEDPDRFDITRPASGHLGFGHGTHACAGMGLARLEASTVLTALLEQVASFQLSGTPRRKVHNLIRAFDSLPIEVTG